jgi:hypothetical protein
MSLWRCQFMREGVQCFQVIRAWTVDLRDLSTIQEAVGWTPGTLGMMRPEEARPEADLEGVEEASEVETETQTDESLEDLSHASTAMK